jgi:hypothetical protein
MSELLKCGGVKKHLVLKIKDIQNLSYHTQNDLKATCICIKANRQSKGKDPYPEYIVVNTDEPYINEIIDVLKRHGAWGDGDTNV